MTAFSIAIGIGHSNVLKAVRGKKTLFHATITDPSNSFKAYRDATKSHNNGAYLPAIQIILKDLAALREFGIFTEGRIKPSIVPLLVRHKREMVQTLLFARRNKLLCSKDISEALKLLPDIDSPTNSLLWQRIYRTIVKGQPFSL